MNLQRLRIYGGVVCVVFLVVVILCRAMVGRETGVWEGVRAFRTIERWQQGYTNPDNKSVTANLPLRIRELADMDVKLAKILELISESENVLGERGRHTRSRIADNQSYLAMANRLGCIKSTAIFATMLNRTMIMPMGDSTVRGYNFSVVFDISHARKCLVREDDNSLPPIITLEEYLGSHGGELRVEKVRCWRAGCLLRDEDRLDLPQHPEVVFPNNSTYLNASGLFTSAHVSSTEFFRALDVEDEILVIGDVFNTAVHDSPHFHTSRPFASPCQAIIQPDAAVMEAAMGFIQTFLGGDYIAAHWRRGDYFSYCKQCFHPIPNVAHCLRHHAITHNATLLFLATNAHEHEIALLRALLSAPSDGRSPRALHVVQLPEAVDAFRTSPWAGSLSRLNLEADLDLVRSTLDRVVSAHAKVFLSTQRSTFSANIRDLRSAWATAHCGDAYICPALAEVKAQVPSRKRRG